MTPPFPLPDTLSQVDALADARHADHDAARRALRTSPFAAAGEIEEEEAGAAAFARILRKNAGAVWEPQSRWLEVG